MRPSLLILIGLTLCAGGLSSFASTRHYHVTAAISPRLSRGRIEYLKRLRIERATLSAIGANCVNEAMNSANEYKVFEKKASFTSMNSWTGDYVPSQYAPSTELIEAFVDVCLERRWSAGNHLIMHPYMVTDRYGLIGWRYYYQTPPP
ncbi:MAG: hypothetical protein P4M11_09660 [Candidatus Pacebacteria bacterium]|nr:hypothetical protein [Candidatus Paceibacterota bacterium]